MKRKLQIQGVPKKADIKNFQVQGVPKIACLCSEANISKIVGRGGVIGQNLDSRSKAKTVKIKRCVIWIQISPAPLKSALGLIWLQEGDLGFTLYQIALSTQIGPRADLALGGRFGIHHVSNRPLSAKSALPNDLILFFP